MRHAGALVVALLGCRAAAPAPPTLIGALRQGLGAFLAAHRLADDAAIRADLVERSSGVSVHVVQIRASERPHRHLEHDLVVQVLSGSGALTLDGTVVPMRAGDSVMIQRHAALVRAVAGDHGGLARGLRTAARCTGHGTGRRR